MRISSSEVAAFRLTMLGLLSLGSWDVCRASTPCASSPAAAVKVYEGESAAGDAGGYRVLRMHRDAVLGTRWASLERCGHPEWPAVTFAVGKASGTVEATGRAVVLPESFALAAPKLVKAGETVRFWRQEPTVRMEMAAVCEEAGAAGDRIRVRVTTHHEYGEQVRYLYGLVHGPADVEMVP